MEENKRFVESLTRLIESKKTQLGVNSSIAEIKGLVKYMDFEEMKAPKSFNINTTMGRFVTTNEEGYQKKCYNSYMQLEKDVYIFDKISSEVAKKVASDMVKIMEDGTIEDVNKYIIEKTGFKHIKVSLLDDGINENKMSLIKEVFGKLKKANLQMVLVENANSEAQTKSCYGILNSRLKANMVGEWSNRVSKAKADIKDFVLLIAVGRIIKDCFDYIEKNPDRIKQLLKDDLEPNHVFEEYTSLDELLEKFNLDVVMDTIEKSKGLRYPLQLISLLNHCIKDIVQETGVVLDYEKSIKELTGDYAKPYMTKKNITKKIENFMNDNKFLNMFGYVEADSDCDLEKLNQLEDEFIELTTKIFLPVKKDHSLRFRRLGKMKADGVYVYPFKALCVDLDGVHSFVHEAFHMIDFTEGLLSLDIKFKQIVNKYTSIVTDKVNSLDKGDSFYIEWNSKNKYNKNYYLNPREIFARAGELYVSEILGVKSSLTRRDFSEGDKAYIYPVDREFLDLVKVYFDELFKNLKDKSQIVSFNDEATVEAAIETTNALDSFNFENLNFAKSNDYSVEQLSLF